MLLLGVDGLRGDLQESRPIGQRRFSKLCLIITRGRQDCDPAHNWQRCCGGCQRRDQVPVWKKQQCLVLRTRGRYWPRTVMDLMGTGRILWSELSRWSLTTAACWRSAWGAGGCNPRITIGYYIRSKHNYENTDPARARGSKSHRSRRLANRSLPSSALATRCSTPR